MPNRGLFFVLLSSFPHHTIAYMLCLGFEPGGCSMLDSEWSTELWWLPMNLKLNLFYSLIGTFLSYLISFFVINGRSTLKLLPLVVVVLVLGIFLVGKLTEQGSVCERQNSTLGVFVPPIWSQFLKMNK